MTTTAPPLLPAARPSRYDLWRARVAADAGLARLYGWLAPLLVTVLAGILRFWNLGHPHSLVFDETYYERVGGVSVFNFYGEPRSVSFKLATTF